MTEDPPPAPAEVAAAGRSFRVDRAREAAFWDAFAAGRWEPETLALIAALTGPGTLFLDVGAWVGPTALHAAAGGARVIALEPDPVARRWLGRNLALNPDLAARVTVLDRALAARPGRVRLAANHGKGGNSMTSALVEGGSAAWQIETLSPAALAAMAAPGERVVANIDIEGGEYDALPAIGPLAARAEALIVSWHPALAVAGRRGAARLRRWLWTARRSAEGLRALRGFGFHELVGGRLERRRGLEAWTALGGPVAPPRGEWVFARPGAPLGAAGLPEPEPGR